MANESVQGDRTPDGAEAPAEQDLRGGEREASDQQSAQAALGANAPQEVGWLFPQCHSTTVVVFVHGILSSSKDCWQNRPRGVFWPHLVHADGILGYPTVFLAGYESGLAAGAFSLEDAVESVWMRIKRSGDEGPSVLQHERVVFVCHSQGGILVQRLLAKYRDKFPQSQLGVVLCGSPSWGSRWATILRPVSWLFGHRQAELLQWGGIAIEQFDRDFRLLVDDPKNGIVGMCLVETRGWFMLPPFVRPESANRAFSKWYRVPKTTHSGLVKPHSVGHESHLHLRTFFKDHNLGAMPASASHAACQGVEVGPAQRDGRGSHIYRWLWACASLLLLLTSWRLWCALSPEAGAVVPPEPKEISIDLQMPLPSPDELIVPPPNLPPPSPPPASSGWLRHVYEFLCEQHASLPVNATVSIDVPQKAEIIFQGRDAGVQVTSTVIKSGNTSVLTAPLESPLVYPGSIVHARSLVGKGEVLSFGALPLGSISIVADNVMSLHDVEAPPGVLRKTLANEVGAYDEWRSALAANAKVMPETACRVVVCYNSDDLLRDLGACSQTPWLRAIASPLESGRRESAMVCVIYTERHFSVAVEQVDSAQWFGDGSSIQEPEHHNLLQAARAAMQVERGNSLAYIDRVDYGRVICFLSRPVGVDLIAAALGRSDDGPLGPESMGDAQARAAEGIAGTLFEYGGSVAVGASDVDYAEQAARESSLASAITKIANSKRIAGDGLRVRHARAARIGFQARYLATGGVLQRGSSCQYALVEPLVGKCQPFHVSVSISKAEIGDDGCAGILELFGNRSKWRVRLSCADPDNVGMGALSDAWDASYKDDGHRWPPGQVSQHSWRIGGEFSGQQMRVLMMAGEGDDDIPSVAYDKTVRVSDILELPPGVVLAGYSGGRRLEQQPASGRNKFFLTISAGLNPILKAELEHRTSEARVGLQRLYEQRSTKK
jgi:pimeloyl-ACP methyl ester carboxylesterase